MNASPTLDKATPTDRPARRVARTPSGGFGLTAMAALYVLTVRQHLHGKRWIVLGALFLFPAALAGLVRGLAPDAPPVFLEFMFVFMFIPQVLLPLLALLYASGIIQDEQEEQTFTYILCRPIPKWAIYFVKVLATATTTVGLMAVFTTLTYLVIYVGADAGGENVPLRCCKAIGIHALTVVVYCCLFGLMSLLTRWTLVLGFLYTALFEAFLANLPFSIRWLTVIYYARLLAYRSMDFIFTNPGGRQENLAAIMWQLPDQNDPAVASQLADHPSLVMCVTVLGVACLVCTALAAFLCSNREFHVKTPQGN
jgi:ABC-2 type transport system permease protein